VLQTAGNGAITEDTPKLGLVFLFGVVGQAAIAALRFVVNPFQEFLRHSDLTQSSFPINISLDTLNRDTLELNRERVVSPHQRHNHGAPEAEPSGFPIPFLLRLNLAVPAASFAQPQTPHL
jgi:hypothetical protein